MKLTNVKTYHIRVEANILQQYIVKLLITACAATLSNLKGVKSVKII